MEVIVENLEKKDLVPSMKNLINKIVENLEEIKQDIIDNNGFSVLENIIDLSLEEATL